MRALLRCRLCWRITLIVFLSILTIEAAILIPSYKNYERDLLLRLEDSGMMAVKAGFLFQAHSTDRNLLIAGKVLVRSSILAGAALYHPDGRLIGTVGETPELTLVESRKSGTEKIRRADGTRYEMLFTYTRTDLPMTVVARMDAAWIEPELIAFVWRISGLVLLISAFVSGITILILGQLILRPMLALRMNLIAAQHDPTNTEHYSCKYGRNDELGDMITAANQLLQLVSETRRFELKEHEKRFEDFADASSDWFWEMDENLRFSFFSERFTHVTAVPADKLLGKTRQESGIPGVDEAVWQRHLDDLASHRPFRGFVHPRCLPSGETVWLSINGKPVFDDEGNFTGYRGTGSEITEAKRVEDALRERVSDLEEAQRKLERQGEDLVRLADDLLIARDEARAADRAKSEFLASMSHELRTPLNAIIGFSEIIKEEVLGPAGSVQYRDYASDIHESGQHLLGLINDILDLSKIESGTDELHEDEIEIPEIVRSALMLVGHRAEQGGIKLELELQDPLPALRADERKLKQILVNLLSNAVKFTEAGGEVTLRAWCRMGSGYVFQIVDTGIGMAPEDIPKALSRFGQVDGDLNRQYEGTGLGLPLTKALVEQHGGVLDLQSQVGVGTTATVRFPAERIVASLDNADSLDVEHRAAS
ncbi:MAG: PAS domain S-box protein [Proteobacteria bacterium]|nr:PAS domain S-box protein [Pseudomonadota bacterium]